MMTIAASDGLKLFIPQVYDIVWSLIILVIVALFFHKFFMPKFNAIFDERAAKIEGNIAKAEQSKKDADAAKSKYEAQLSTARVEASRFVTTPVPKLPTSSPTHAPARSPTPPRSPPTRSAPSSRSSSRRWSPSRAKSVLLPRPWPARFSVPSLKATTCSPR